MSESPPQGDPQSPATAVHTGLRVCLACGRQYEPRQAAQSYCSAACRAKHHTARRRDLRARLLQIVGSLRALTEDLEAVSHELCPEDGAEPDIGTVTGKDVRRFSDAFIALYGHHNRGARYLWRGARDTESAKRLLRTYGHERLVQLAECLQAVDDDWIALTDRGMGILEAKASWLDQRLALVGGHR